MKLMPKDQLLIAPGRDKEKIMVVAMSIGDCIVGAKSLFIVVVLVEAMIVGVGGG
jgi:hypothetical protein